ncbi:MAG: UDP-N-acetylmuramoyl-L-alanyl-D-glutamate--2,6-diaminopimelate ligase [Phycisphaerae bacterium]|nr:UDP-N-acetylmuramoyl-L-alanyl-D-glutamate--2,6-diaminopimelate ligase [Phycisphaerae bacterium]
MNSSKLTESTLQDLLEGVPLLSSRGSLSATIRRITEDSRDVGPGSIFVARTGEVHDGRQFIPAANAAGAEAILIQGACPDEVKGPCVIGVEDLPGAMALISHRLAGNPSRELELYGITGTNGKTTISFLLSQLLESIGVKAGLVGTVSIDDGSGPVPAEVTTPDAIRISSILSQCVDNGCRAAVMEVSSHGLQQQRTSALEFDVAIFTNLTGDHLDYHGSMEAYADAKALLFEQLDAGATAVVNADDPASQRMIRDTRADVLTYGLDQTRVDAHAHIKRLHLDRSEVVLDGPWGRQEHVLALVGRHNVANMLASLLAAWSRHQDRRLIESLPELISPPAGRFEPVHPDGAPFAVLVDYAHTDDALARALSALRAVLPEHGTLRVVFGCGGDRDRTKRPRMAQVACSLADEVYITSDNPRTEDPMAIIADVLEGVPADGVPVHHDPDRTSSIHRAIHAAVDGDVVLIAGKGHEDYQIIGTTRIHFDDREVAREALADRLDMQERP